MYFLCEDEIEIKTKLLNMSEKFLFYSYYAKKFYFIIE